MRIHLSIAFILATASAILFGVSGSSRSVGEESSIERETEPTAPPRAGGPLRGSSGMAVKSFPLTGGASWATYLGGAGEESARGVPPRIALAVEASGNVYVGGTTASADFPVSPKSNQALRGGAEDLFLAKIDPAGRLIYSLVLGGGGDDRLTALALDPTGSLVVVGETDSPDFPSPNGSPLASVGAGDIFVLRIDGATGRLNRATVLGGSGPDSPTGVALDSRGNVLVAGWTESPDFPTRPGTGLAVRGGGADAFVMRLAADSLNFDFSSFLGGQGTGNDRASSIALESDGSIVLVGDTSSPDFPVTPHSSDPTYNGGADAFVAKLSPDGSDILFSSFLGGGGDDFGSDVVLTRDGKIVLVGSTASLDFPTAAARSPFPSGGWNSFLATLSRDGSTLELSTCPGALGDDLPGMGPRVALTPGGDLLTLGSTASEDFPAQESLRSPAAGGSWSVFLTRFNPFGEVRRSTLLSGSGSDYGLALAADRRGAVWLAGVTGSQDLPLRGAFQPFHAGGDSDAFLARLDNPLGSVALLGIEQVTLKKGATLHSGDAVVNQPGLLAVEKDVSAPAGFQLMADRIDVKKGARIDSNLFFNQLTSRGEITGQLTDVLELPVIADLPAFKPASPGELEIVVDKNQFQWLPLGRYSRVELKENAVLELAAGEIDILQLDAKQGSRILFDGPSLLRVAGHFRTDRDVFVGPAEGAAIDSSDILVVAEGSLGHTVEFGLDSRVQANFYAPAGRLRILGGARVEGAFLAREAVAEADAEILLDSYFESPPPPSNRPPVAEDDEVSTLEDTPVSIAVLANDHDPDGDPLIITDFAQGENGQVSITSDGQLVYSPRENFHGEDGFTYSIWDQRGEFDSASVRIVVEPVNDPPIARVDQVSTDEDRAARIEPLANDGDADGDPLVLDLLGAPGHGSVRDLGGGVVEYSPDPDFNGADGFSYTVSDGAGGTSQSSVEVTVLPVNDPPVAGDDFSTVAEDGSVAVDVLANDSDVDGDILTLGAFQQGSSGTVERLDDRLVYTPRRDFNGSDNFTYRAVDPAGASSEATVHISVEPANDPPLASDDEAETEEDGSVDIAVLSNDEDPDGDVIRVVSHTSPAHGTATETAPGVFNYHPEADFNGNDAFSYQVEDSAGASASAQVRVVVTPVNDAPVALPDLATTDEDSVIAIAVLDNDSDIDGDGLRLVSVTQPGHGTVHANPDESITYVPELNFHGVDSFTYSVGDGVGGEAIAPVQITVLPINDPPLAADDFAELAEDGDILIAALDNDSDPDGEPLSLESVSQPLFGQATIEGALLRYTPRPDFFGEDHFGYTVTDPSGVSDNAQVWLTVTPVNDPPTLDLSATPVSGPAPLAVLLTATAEDPDGDSLSYAWDFGDGSSAQGSDRQNHLYTSAGTFLASVVVADAQTTVRREVTVDVLSSLPPDPAAVAPPLDRTAAVTVGAASEFLYTGDHPIQEGVAPGSIDPVRAAVVRGRVLDRRGDPLAGVEVKVLGHPEWGRTLTRQDGMYDLAVNGGGVLNLEFGKPGRLPAQRQVDPGWQDFAVVEDVVLVEFDSQVSEIDLGSGDAMQTARGSVVADADGARQATVLFPSGVTAQLRLPDGSTQPLGALRVRATEFTVGENGPKSMPAPLPPASFYTYALALTVDEALEAGADEVRFSRPVPLYVENFLDFPVGTEMPLGYFDPRRGEWVAEENGRVLGVLEIVGGLAELDVDGDGQAASAARLAEMGIEESERAELATLYVPGQTLWRAPIPHFSLWDLNLGWAPPADARPPSVLGFFERIWEALDRFCSVDGSIIECENQTLGESIPLAGTPWTLNYRSDRTIGRRTSRQLDIPLSGDSIPDSLDSIELEVEVAGRVSRKTFPAQPNMSATFSWDGRDPYGRQLQGQQEALVRVGYTYQGRYAATDRFNRPSFDITLTPLRTGVTFWQEQETPVGPAWDAFAEGLGGWTLSARHVYDPLGGILYYGDGTRRTVRNLEPIIETAVRSGVETFSSNPDGLAVAADGTLYVSSGIGGRVSALRPDGAVEFVAGTGFPTGPVGDGGPALDALLLSPRGLAVGRDGSLYIAEIAGHRVRRVTPDGIITTVAGTGEAGFSGDGGPAVQAQLRAPRAVAVGADGSIFIADSDNRRIRRVGTDGLISTVAGSGDFGTSGDDGPAREARFRTINDLALAADGTLFILDSEASVVRRVTPGGRIHRFAGSGGFGAFEDGIPAIEARLFTPRGIAFAPDGGLLISSGTQDRVRLVRPDGIIITVAGVGERGNAGDGGPAAQASLASPGPLACSPDGSYAIGVQGRVRRVVSPLPEFSAADLLVASEDGSQIYRFDSTGRHLQTLHGLTGAVLLEFSYDSAGRLLSAVDGDGNTITVERDSQGMATAIVAPLGQRTELGMDGQGRLTSITDPVGAAFRMQYSPEGLLVSLTNPRGHASVFDYDPLGLLIRDTGAAGQAQSLSRTNLPDGYQVVHSTAMGRSVQKTIRETPLRERIRLAQFPDGATARSTEKLDGTQELETANGTLVVGKITPDPRFGTQSATAGAATMTTPSGLTHRRERRVEATLSDPSDPLSATTVTQVLETNGRALTGVYNPADRSVVVTSPEGRVTSMAIDDQGRLILRQTSGLFPTTLEYDSIGRLSSMRQGSGAEQRVTSFDYAEDGCLVRITDPEGAQLGLECDAAGRVVSQTLPDGRRAEITFDAHGNPASLTPPGRPAHVFEYNEADNPVRYAPPDVNPGPDDSVQSYNLDQQLTRISRPDGETIDFHYDDTGRVEALEIARGMVRYHYNPSGEISEIVAPDGQTVAFDYDGVLPLSASWSGTVAGSVSRTFDNDFRIASESVNGQHTVSFTYDEDGLLTGAGSMALVPDPQNGLLTATQLGEVQDSWTHSGFAEPVAYSAAFQTSGLIEFDWTRNKLGKVVAKAETVLGQTRLYEYAYDVSGRLVEVRTDGQTASSYAYDSNGNRTALTRNGRTVAATYDEQDRLLQYGDVSFTYTAAGDLRTRTENGSTTTYRYDALGNLISVSLPDGTEVEYAVDGRNRRIGKKVNGQLRQGFLYSGQLRIVAELDGAGQVLSRFVYGGQRNVPDYMVREGRTFRILSDIIGSPRLVVDVLTGEIVQRIDYDEFGRVLSDSNPGFQPFGFAGGLDDRQIGLVRFGARDYSPETGRWTAPDPLTFGGGDLNLYGYALNDPINLIDENGQVVTVIAAGAILGALTNVVWAWYSDRANFDLQQAAAAAVSGAISGGLGALAGPLGGSVARFLGSTSASWLAKGISVAFSSLGGLIGQSLANLIDPRHPTSLCTAAGTAGLGAGVASFALPASNTTRTLRQALQFRHNLGNLLFFATGEDSFRIFRTILASTVISGTSNFF